jgi:hypothetical protein
MRRGGIWNWSPDVSRSGARDDATIIGSGNSFRVVRTLAVAP